MWYWFIGIVVVAAIVTYLIFKKSEKRGGNGWINQENCYMMSPPKE